MTAEELKNIEIALDRYRGYIDGALTEHLTGDENALAILSLDRELVDMCRSALEREAARTRARDGGS